MSPRSRTTGALVAAGVAAAALLAPAVASADRVTSPRPWKATNTYLVRQSLDGRTAPKLEPRAKVDHVRAGQWVRISCQTTGENAYGSTIWDKVGAYYVPDYYIRTFTTGFIKGVPRCKTGKPPAPTTSALYNAANAAGFGAVPAGYKRVSRNLGARNRDDGIVLLRWFIPNAVAGGRLLVGDGRGFSADPAAVHRSRATLAWNTKTGATTFTVTPTTVATFLPKSIKGPGICTKFKIPYPCVKDYPVPRGLRGGQHVPALPIAVRSNFDAVHSTDWHARSTNDVALRNEGGGVHVKASLVNSVTNDFTVSAAGKRISPGAWSVDYDVTIKRRPAGGYAIRAIGNGYPAIEAYYYGRTNTVAHTRFQRKIDPAMRRTWRKVGPISLDPLVLDPGGGVGALNEFSWFTCTDRPDGGSFCDKRGSSKGQWFARAADYTTSAWSAAE
ncbi:hypothetical protein [Patulibacter defluvii]|uniref:hypothetical protein n=1 Tax=Patulibacter defluvii TaxID=3095358 RepID=UPI002A75A353|nr:hypothetical protein [Patulibacter sp. DM4]